MTLEFSKKLNGESVMLALIYDAIVETVNDAIFINGHLFDNDQPFTYTIYDKDIINVEHSDDEKEVKYVLNDNSEIFLSYM